MTPRGQESTPVAFKEVGNRRGGEEHTSMGSSSAQRGERERHLPQEV